MDLIRFFLFAFWDFAKRFSYTFVMLGLANSIPLDNVASVFNPKSIPTSNPVLSLTSACTSITTLRNHRPDESSVNEPNLTGLSIGCDSHNLKACPEYLTELPSILIPDDLNGIHPSDLLRLRHDSRILLACLHDFANCSATAFTVAECKPRSFAHPAVRLFNSKPVKVFLNFFHRSWLTSLQ